MATTENKINEQQLNKEYALCQKTTNKIESTIWSTSAAMGIGSLAPLIALLMNDKIEAIPAIIIGLLIYFTSLIWYFMALRWWDIQHTTFLRMKHIEEKLEIFQISYIYYRDGQIDLIPNGTSLNNKNIDELKGDNITKFHLRGVKKWLRLLPWFILFSWGEFVIYLFFLKNCTTKNWIAILFILPYLITIAINIRITHCGSKKAINKINARY